MTSLSVSAPSPAGNAADASACLPACVLGASVICVDLVVQRFPGKEDWRIQDSSVFLACSLSLSFGVMLFSALFSMLPSAKAYLHTAGLSDQAGGFILSMLSIYFIFMRSALVGSDAMSSSSSF